MPPTDNSVIHSRPVIYNKRPEFWQDDTRIEAKVAHIPVSYAVAQGSLFDGWDYRGTTAKSAASAASLSPSARPISSAARRGCSWGE